MRNFLIVLAFGVVTSSSSFGQSTDSLATPSFYPQTAASSSSLPAATQFVDPFDPSAATPASFDASIPATPVIADDSNPFPAIAAIDKKLSDFISGTKATTYPNVKVNGVFQADSAWINQDDVSRARYGAIRDGVDFRRARLAASGSLTETTNYFFQMDFAFFGRPTFTDLWVEQVDLPFLGAVRVGQWKQPFSLEVVSSFRYTTFVERSVLFQAFTPFRHIGAGIYNRNKEQTMTWAASIFGAGNDQFGGSTQSVGGYATAERLTFLPYYDEPSDGRYYLHLGAGHYFSAPNNHTVNFRTIPELYVGQFDSAASAANQQPTPTMTRGMPFFIATGNMSVSNFNVLGSELLWVRGPFSLQSEGMLNIVDQTVGQTVFFTGAYAQVGYFLTGEHRPYDRRAGAIDRIKPFENVFSVRDRNGCCCRGWGAWELAGRVSTINLRGNYTAVPSTAFAGELIGGGILTDYTAGLNWYLNPYTKCQLNYIYSQASNAARVDAITNLFDMRIQMDF